MKGIGEFLRPRIAGRSILSFLCGLLLSMFLASVGISEARVLHVTPTGAGTRDGRSWVNALGEAEFAKALQDAEAGVEFWVAKGMYRPSIDPAASGDAFLLKNGVALYGGFTGVEATSGDRDWENNVTVLTGDLGGDDILDGNGVVGSDGIRGLNSRNVVRGEGCDASAVLDGFFVTGGDAVSKGRFAGGGLYLSDSSPTIRRCVFVENRARDEGGGAYLKGSAASFESCTFLRNKTRGFFATSGGGMYNEKSNPRMTDCTFSENRAHRGGGVFNTNSRPTLMRCNFSRNVAEDMGGGMYNGNTSDADLNRCVFTGNKAWTDSWGSPSGGGLYNTSSSPALKNCVFEKNESMEDGGGMFNQGNSRPIVTGCAFLENGARYGGGMYNGTNNDSIEQTDFSVPVTNCTFWGNTAQDGGGMFNSSGNVFATHCTFFGNKTAGKPALVNVNSAVTVFNCVFWNSESGLEVEHRYFSGPRIATQFSHCVVRGRLVSGDISLSDVSGEDPRLGVPASNGGFTPTCALDEGSPARNAGALKEKMPHLQSLNPRFRNNVLAALRRDQRGFSRLDGKPDIGAYEYSSGAQQGEVFFITASADAGGSIEPSGEVVVREGETDRTFVVNAKPGFRISEVRVDGKPVPIDRSSRKHVHTFHSVGEDHDIHAAFEVAYFSGLSVAGASSSEVRPGSAQTFGFELVGDPDVGFDVIRDVYVGYRTRSGAIGRQYAWWMDLPVRNRNISLVFKPMRGLEDGVLTLAVELGNGTILAANLSITVKSGDVAPDDPLPGPNPKPNPLPDPGSPPDRRPAPSPRPSSEDKSVFIPRDPAGWSAAFFGTEERGLSIVELSADIRLSEPVSAIRADTRNFVNGIESWSLYSSKGTSDDNPVQALGLRPYRLYRLRLVGRVRDSEWEGASIRRLVFGFKDGSQAVRDFPGEGLKVSDVLRKDYRVRKNGESGGCGVMSWGALSLLVPAAAACPPRRRRGDGRKPRHGKDRNFSGR